MWATEPASTTARHHRRRSSPWPSGSPKASPIDAGGVGRLAPASSKMRSAGGPCAPGISPGYARYIGRIGALAVALGIGAAITAGAGAAFADPSEADESSTSDNGPSPADTPDPVSPESDDSAATDAAGSSGSTTRTKIGADKVPDMQVDSSGGALTSTLGTQTTRPHAADDTSTELSDEPSESAEPPVDGIEAGATPTDTRSDASPASKHAVPSGVPKQGSKSAVTRTQSAVPDATPTATLTADEHRMTSAATPFTASSVGFGDASEPPSTVSVAPSVAPMPTVTDLATQQDTAGSEVTPGEAPVGVVSKLLPLVGLGITDADAPAMPIQTPIMWTVLALAQREIGGRGVRDTATGSIDTTAQKIGGSAPAEDLASVAPLAADTALGSATPSASVAPYSLLAGAVVILPTNSPPVFVSEQQSPDAATGVVTGQVVFSDPDGDPLTYALGGAVPATAQSLTVTPDGHYTYTPTDTARHNAADDDAVLSDTTDSFVMTVDDGQGGTADYTVALDIAPANTAPVFVSHQQSTDTGTGVVSGQVIFTDADGDTLTYTPDSGIPAASFAAASFAVAVTPTLTYGGSTTTDKGTVVVDTDTGNYIYTPTDTARHNAAADNADPQDLTDSFVMTVDDGHGGTADYTVALSVVSANAAPTVTATAGTPDPGTGAVPVTVTLADPDNDPLTLQITDPTHGDLAPDGTGNYTYTPTDTARHDSTITTDSVTLTVTDDHGGTGTYTLTLPIAPANAAPTVTATAGTPDPGTGAVPVTVTLADPDNDPLTLQITDPTHGDLAPDGTGNYTYTPTDTARHNAAGSGPSTDSVTLTVTDDHGATATYTLTLPISAANDPPTYLSDPQSTDTGTGVVSGQVVFTDADGDTLTYALGSAVPATAQSLTLTPDGHYTYTPTDAARHNAAGSGPTADSFVMTVDDGHGGTADYTVALSVVSANAAPTVTATAGTPDPGTGAVPVTVTLADPDNDPLTLQITDPTHGDLAPDGTGNYTYTPTDTARHDSTITTDSVTLTVTDDHGGTATYTLTLPIAPANAAPTVTATAGTPDPGTGAVPVTVTLADPDNDPLTLQITDPTHGDLAPDGTGNYTYTPTDTARHDAAGSGPSTDSVTLTVTDDHGATATYTLTLPISAANQPPVFVSHRQGADESTGVVTGQVVFTDPDGDTLTYDGSIITDKGTIVVDTETGNYTYTPTDTARHNAAADNVDPQDLTDSFVMTVDDGHGGTADYTVALDVLPANGAPVLVSGQQGADDSTGVVSGQLVYNDPDGDTLTYTIGGLSDKAESVTIDRNGNYTYTPTDEARQAAADAAAQEQPTANTFALAAVAAPDPTTDSFVVTVDDGHGGTLSTSVTVAIVAATVAGDVGGVDAGGPVLGGVAAGSGGGGGIAPGQAIVADQLAATAPAPAATALEERSDSGRTNGRDRGSRTSDSDVARRDSASPTGQPRSTGTSAPGISAPASELPQANSLPPGIGLTSRVENGTQAMAMSIIFLMVGGWVYGRRILEN